MIKTEELIQILEKSMDWYLVLAVDTNTNTITTIYSNHAMMENCGSVCSTQPLNPLSIFDNCGAFAPLKDTILQVYQTKKSVHIPEYIFGCVNKEEQKVLDLQIYTNNGHVVLCGRDLSPIYQNIRTEAARLVQQMDQLIKERMHV